MNAKNLYCAIISLVLLWSCGKDDGTTPAPEKNSAPKIEAQSFTVAEDISDTATIGTVKAENLDEDELTFSISETDLFEIDDVGKLSLIDGKNLDYELTKEHSIKISVSDGEAESAAIITISVTNVKDSLSEDSNSFITKWDVPHNNFKLILGTNEDYQYDFIIDWGDGSPEEEITLQDPAHVYEKAGIYFISIQGDFPAIQMGDLNDYPRQSALIGIQQWGNIVWRSFYEAFSYCNYLVEYNAADAPNLENVEIMNFAFHGATRFNADLSDWDVSNVKKMGMMFHSAYDFNGEIGNWDVSNVVNMFGMFGYAEEFDQDLGSWNIQSVEVMTSMFNYSGISAENYGATLIGWSNKENTPMGLSLGVNDIEYCLESEAATARETLINDFGWTFSGDTGIDCN
ncbi:BspA family leucine-rich repeat surface protein [Flagellimonas sp.]|uniref:BspA family leucine-rich repeat surface protein n=1 Tax=Flagellimonas sp. TaxID=2058762 RepID=UPI003BA952AF